MKQVNTIFWRLMIATGFLGVYLLSPVFMDMENVEANEASNSNLKTFHIYMDNFNYDVREIRVKKGDRVRLVVTNMAKHHNLKIKEFNVWTGNLKNKETKTVEFVANKTGEFEYRSDILMDRQMGMRGELIVE